MKHTVALIGLLIASVGHGAVPDIAWFKMIGGSAVEHAWSVATDSSGHAYVTGDFQGTNLMFGEHLATQFTGTTMFVARFDRFGSNVWVSTAGGSGSLEGRGIALDGSGNVYVFGSMRGGQNFFGSTNLTSSGSEGFLAKLNSSGEFQWVRQLRDPQGWIQVPTSLTIHGPNIYVAGQCHQGVDFGSLVLASAGIFLGVYDLDGNPLAARALAEAGASEGMAWQVAVEPNGDYYAAMEFGSLAISFGGTNVSRSGNYFDGLLTKWSSDGNLLWFKHAAGGDFASCNGVSLAPNGDALVVGRTSLSGTFDGQPVNDAYIARVTSGGETLWVRSLVSNSSFEGVATDLKGNIYVSGSVGPGTWQFNGFAVTNSSLASVPFIARLNPAGDFAWAMCGRSISTASSGNYGTAHRIIVDPRGAVFLTGFADVPLQFGSQSGVNHGAFDLFLARLAPEPPHLRILSLGPAVTLVWPTNQMGFGLERADSLSGPWFPAIAPAFRSGVSFVSTNPVAQKLEFFRLREQ
jgi:hypothetical protein